MARADARPNSDIDLLVEIEPGRRLLDVIALEPTGRTVDSTCAGPWIRLRNL